MSGKLKVVSLEEIKKDFSLNPKDYINTKEEEE